jgi:hypothetical protein
MGAMEEFDLVMTEDCVGRLCGGDKAGERDCGGVSGSSLEGDVLVSNIILVTSTT